MLCSPVDSLGSHKVRKARGNAADVFFYCDSSIAPLLDMRRRFKAVMDVRDAVIRHGASLCRSVELAAPWDDILAVGPLYPATLDDLHAVEGFGLGDFHRVVSAVHHRLSDFVRGVVVHSRDEVIRGWRDWLWEHPAPVEVASSRFGSPCSISCSANLNSLTPGGFIWGTCGSC